MPSSTAAGSSTRSRSGDVAISKREAGVWALDHLPDRWHPLLRAAIRNYDGEATPDDVQVLAAGMAPFVDMVRDALSRSA